MGQTLTSARETYYIAAVNKEKSGLVNKEFTYRVVHANDHTKVYDEKAYESQLMALEKNGQRRAR